MGPKANCERMAQIMFGAYNVPGDGAKWDDMEKMRREAESFLVGAECQWAVFWGLKVPASPPTEVAGGRAALPTGGVKAVIENPTFTYTCRPKS